MEDSFEPEELDDGDEAGDAAPPEDQAGEGEQQPRKRRRVVAEKQEARAAKIAKAAGEDGA